MVITSSSGTRIKIGDVEYPAEVTPHDNAGSVLVIQIGNEKRIVSMFGEDITDSHGGGGISAAKSLGNWLRAITTGEDFKTRLRQKQNLKIELEELLGKESDPSACEDLKKRLRLLSRSIAILEAAVDHRPIINLGAGDEVPSGYYLALDGRYLFDQELFEVEGDITYHYNKIYDERNKADAALKSFNGPLDGPRGAELEARRAKLNAQLTDVSKREPAAQIAAKRAREAKQQLQKKQLQELANAYAPGTKAVEAFGTNPPWHEMSIPEIKSQLFVQSGITIQEDGKAWSEWELREVAQLVSEMGARAQNEIKFITRVKSSPGEGRYRSSIGTLGTYNYSRKEIRLMDGAFQGHFRWASLLPNTDRATTTTRIVGAHELGHGLLPDGLSKDRGWSVVDEAGLRKQLSEQKLTAMADDIIAQLESTRDSRYYDRQVFRMAGKIFMVDPDYPGKYCILDDGAVPGGSLQVETEARLQPLLASQNPVAYEWGYGRTSPLEYGADANAIGMNAPHHLYHQLVTAPEQIVHYWSAEVEKHPSDTNKEKLHQARRDCERKAEDWVVLRAKHGVSDKWIEALAEALPLRERNQFRHDAQRCMTPKQISDLYIRAGGKGPMDRVLLSWVDVGGITNHGYLESILGNYLGVEYLPFDQQFREKILKSNKDLAPQLFAFLESQAGVPNAQRSTFRIRGRRHRLLDDGRVVSYANRFEIEDKATGKLTETVWSRAMARGGFKAVFDEAMQMAANDPNRLYIELRVLPSELETADHADRIRLFNELWQLVRTQAGINPGEILRIKNAMLAQIPTEKHDQARGIVGRFANAAERVCTRKQLANLVQVYTQELMKLFQ